ncbi:MAG: hypothetical protein EOP82_24625 [Variovorax sp.]|nr:MAG: hypothetical protein EOP82_24625 [Variovorax sp.]
MAASNLTPRPGLANQVPVRSTSSTSSSKGKSRDDESQQSISVESGRKPFVRTSLYISQGVEDLARVSQESIDSKGDDTVIEFPKPTLGASYQDEKSKWSTRYNDPTDTTFKNRIDAYHEARSNFMEANRGGDHSNIKEQSNQLRTRLAVAYELLDANTKHWT